MCGSEKCAMIECGYMISYDLQALATIAETNA
jgi:hypothetical protein